jgi:hypothetical protein
MKQSLYTIIEDTRLSCSVSNSVLNIHSFMFVSNRSLFIKSKHIKHVIISTLNKKYINKNPSTVDMYLRGAVSYDIVFDNFTFDKLNDVMCSCTAFDNIMLKGNLFKSILCENSNKRHIFDKENKLIDTTPSDLTQIISLSQKNIIILDVKNIVDFKYQIYNGKPNTQYITNYKENTTHAPSYSGMKLIINKCVKTNGVFLFLNTTVKNINKFIK